MLSSVGFEKALQKGAEKLGSEGIQEALEEARKRLDNIDMTKMLDETGQLNWSKISNEVGDDIKEDFIDQVKSRFEKLNIGEATTKQKGMSDCITTKPPHR